MKNTLRSIVYWLLVAAADKKRKKLKRIRASYSIILEEVIAEALPEVASMISGACPFCGRRYKRLYQHLTVSKKHNGCARSLKAMADAISERISERIERARRGRRYTSNKRARMLSRIPQEAIAVLEADWHQHS